MLKKTLTAAICCLMLPLPTAMARPRPAPPPRAQLRQLPAHRMQYEYTQLKPNQQRRNKARINVTGPKNGRAQIHDNGRLLADRAIPFTWETTIGGERFYDLTIQQPDGDFWRGKVGLHPGQQLKAWLTKAMDTPVIVAPPPPPPTPRQLPPHAIQTQYWSIDRPRMVEVHVAGPAGGRAQIHEDGRLLADQAIPFVYEARERRKETFDLTIQRPDGAFWRGAVQIYPGQRVNVWIGERPPGLGAPPAVRPAPPPPRRQGMHPRDFGQLKAAIEREAFTQNRHVVFQTALGPGPLPALTVLQLGELLDLFEMGADKLKVLELGAPRLVDRQNGYLLIEKFTFTRDKDRARQILGA